LGEEDMISPAAENEPPATDSKPPIADPFLTLRVDDLLKFYKANSKLFMDRQPRVPSEKTFDPGFD